MTFTANQQVVVDLFIAAYGRTPTQNALDFFESKLNNQEMTPLSISDFMMDSKNNPEAQIRYPNNLSTSQKVETVFKNVLGRGTATQEGLDYWSNKIDNDDSYSMSNLMKDVLDSAKNQPNDAKTLDNKSSVVGYFLDKIPTTKQISNIIYLDKVVSLDSVTIAKEEIDTLSTNKSNINNGYGELSTLKTEGVEVIDSGEHWSSDQAITFSFNSTMPTEYNAFDGLSDHWTPLNREQQNAVRNIMNELNKIIDVPITERPNQDGMIRFNMVNMPDKDIAGFAYMPIGTYAGDVFLSNEFNNKDSVYNFRINEGENGYSTIVHELGHALGLQHPFESPIVSTIEDDTNHSIMSYISFNDKIIDFSVDGSTIHMYIDMVAPNLYSLYDVSALQAIYGANTKTALEDNVYRMKYTDYEIQTIWDAGGRDKIDLSDTKGNSTIDLHSGTINSADQYSTTQIITMHQQHINKTSVNGWIKDNITALSNSKELYTGENNLTIAQGVIIEDITTGGGDDTITDNEVDNVILTGRGDDKIFIGSGGEDFVDGGAGTDTLYLDILSTQMEIEKKEESIYILSTDTFMVEFENIEQLHFSDNSMHTPDFFIV